MNVKNEKKEKEGRNSRFYERGRKGITKNIQDYSQQREEWGILYSI